ncbi:TetR/AcrR family transcriptional regulator [Rothia aerolata]|uniref:TetR family transcriptional regulator n=1 Tax=Rothia aerolata TaxID=1812262 RepID=A0A917IWJ3_9MICC|nr:TetR/AcrR family transcriptional regulator [Rothia aerolata]GGH65261.1 TetR family transcriptional regulator [Rothia aerolata]
MGRTATFDRQATVERARDLFWAQGYDATAVPDLERATGLKRSSLYHAFGSKKGLFDEAVQSYLNDRVRPLLAQMKDADAAPDTLARYFKKVRGGVLTEKVHPGCLLIAAANTPIGADPVVADVITGYYDELLEAFTAGVRAASSKLSEEQARARAQALVALNVSALALARTSPSLAVANLDAALSLCEQLED